MHMHSINVAPGLCFVLINEYVMRHFHSLDRNGNHETTVIIAASFKVSLFIVLRCP